MSVEKVAVSSEEQGLPYFKYFERGLAPIDEKYLAIMGGPVAAADSALPLDRVNDFVAEKDAGFCQAGFGNFSDGTGFVCNELYWPGVRGEMLDWWWVWHCTGSDLRYKMWHPHDHQFEKSSDSGRLLNPEIPIKERLWGTTYFLYERLGEFSFVPIGLADPVEAGIDPSLLGTPECEGITFGRGQGIPPIVTMEKWFPRGDGLVLKSRFWLGYTIEDKVPVKAIPDGAVIPEIILRLLYKHCVEEYNNLGSFLPELFAEEGGRL